MEDGQHNPPGQIEPREDTAVGQLGEDPTQPAIICPLDLSSRSRDDVLISPNGDNRRRRNAWLLEVTFVAVFGLGWAGGANWHRLSDFEADSKPRTEKGTYLRPDLGSATNAAKPDSPYRTTTTTTGCLGT